MATAQDEAPSVQRIRPSTPKRSGPGDGDATLDDQIERVGFGKFQYLTMFAFACFIIADGMELVVTNVTWGVLPREEWGMEGDSMRGTLISLSYFGFVLGAFIGGLSGDHVGRRPLLYIHSVIFIPASIASALSASIEQLLITRFLVGISIGIVLPTVITMTAEFTPMNHRGKAIVLIPSISYTTGQMLVLLLGIYLITSYGYNCENCDWWRWMFVAGIFPDIVGIILVYTFVPESPRFLLVRDKMDDLKSSLRRIAQMNDTEDKLVNDGACAPLPPDERLQKDMWVSTAELFQEPLVRTVPLGVFTWCFISVALFSQSFLWPIYVEASGYDLVTQYWLMILVVFVEVPSVLLIFNIIDLPTSEGSDQLMFSRRSIIFIFALVSSIVILLHTYTRTLGPIWMVAGNVLMRMLTLGPYEVMYVYIAELMPTSHRNTGLALGNGATKIVAAILPLVLLPLMHVDDFAPFVLICVCAFSATLLIWVSPDVDRELCDSSTELQDRTRSWPRWEQHATDENTPLLTEEEKSKLKLK